MHFKNHPSYHKYDYTLDRSPFSFIMLRDWSLFTWRTFFVWTTCVGLFKCWSCVFIRRLTAFPLAIACILTTPFSALNAFLAWKFIKIKLKIWLPPQNDLSNYAYFLFMKTYNAVAAKDLSELIFLLSLTRSGYLHLPQVLEKWPLNKMTYEITCIST